MKIHRAIVEAGPGAIRRLCCSTSGFADKDMSEIVAESLAAIDQLVKKGISVEARYGTSMSVSAGIATYPEDGLNAEALLEKADERMYETKRRRQLLRVA